MNEGTSGAGSRPTDQALSPLTASAKRRAIERLLKRKATAGLSDREIARRTGASPSTVGKVRAGLAA